MSDDGQNFYPCRIIKLSELSNQLMELVEQARKDIEQCMISSLPPPTNKPFDLLAYDPQEELVSKLQHEHQKITSETKRLHHSYSVRLSWGDSAVGERYFTIIIPLTMVGDAKVKIKDSQGTHFQDIDWNEPRYFYVTREVVFRVTGKGQLGALIMAFERG
ncbi:MAG: hypothetical protein M1834_009742 [Cirrosporium novae-zelandiae]|nr:MAG: hypothetical protein M1834_009742 [Cirrosporium novae-zelandiae]